MKILWLSLRAKRLDNIRNEYLRCITLAPRFGDKTRKARLKQLVLARKRDE